VTGNGNTYDNIIADDVGWILPLPFLVLKNFREFSKILISKFKFRKIFELYLLAN